VKDEMLRLEGRNKGEHQNSAGEEKDVRRFCMQNKMHILSVN